MSTSQQVKQSEGASGSRRSGPPEDEGGDGVSSTENSSGWSPARTLPPEESLDNPPQPEMFPFAGKAEELLTARDQAVPTTSSRQSEQLADAIKKNLFIRVLIPDREVLLNCVC